MRGFMNEWMDEDEVFAEGDCGWFGLTCCIKTGENRKGFLAARGTNTSQTHVQ